MKVIIASKNKGKIKEFEALLKPLGIEVVEKDFEDVIEDGDTFEENSLIKAKSLYNQTKMNVIADDSGLNIEVYGNWPGVHTAREFSEYKTDKEKCSALLLKMNNEKNRNAHFTSVITLILDGNIYQFKGIANGEISQSIQGENGHGFDSVFYSFDLKKTFGQSSIEEKNKYSHRGIAFKKLVDFLKTKA